jgi:hypothetical protein
MKLDPFIEAEEAEGRSVTHCCDLFQVSRSATTSAGRPSRRKGPSPTPSSPTRSRWSTRSPTAPTGRRGSTRCFAAKESTWASAG